MKIKKWTLYDQTMILKRLSSLLDKGYTLNEALNFIYLNEHGSKRMDLLQCLNQLSSGNSLRKALSQLHFHRDVISYLYFAEQHGDLEFSLRECSEILQKKITQFDKLTKLLRYPLFLLISVGIILTIVHFIISPQFEQLYQSMNIETSFFSVFLIVVFSALKWLSLLAVAFSIGLVSYYFFVFRKKSVEERMMLLVKIPLIRRLFMILHSYFFSLQLSNLLKGGMSTLESLKVFQNQDLLPFFKVEGNHLISRLSEGEQLHTIIEERGFYEKELSLVILHGQANGQLSRELYTYSQLIIEKLEQSIIKIMTMIQPVIYAFVGIIVLFVYLSMLMPMYKMMENF
ncbi:competence type IV pilus assembly protein ComGB [Metabacillus schmidteae]|uniref:competence type IV pilus assembly protein ComGB n=1 Tax=Metabacillus schmidteae TaxID=2730405 RepID=UPI00158E1402|nr:competence type IV pilus assembly protein ComGB [Metabacillus schmidteae]